MKSSQMFRYIVFCLTSLAAVSCGVDVAYNNGEDCFPEGGAFWKCDVSEYCDRSAEAPVCKKLDVKCEGSNTEFDNGYGYCMPGYVCIGGNCMQLTNDVGFCSEQTAATVCGRNAQCIENVCKCGEVDCAGNNNACCMAEDGSGGCFDLQSDKGNCGECGHACVDVQTCESGVCVCPQNRVLCDGKCIDPLTDVKYCGARGACSQSDIASGDYNGNVCNSDQFCIDGRCNDDVGSVICSWVYDKDKAFYKYLEYSSEEACRETLNHYYVCSETLHALTDMYMRPLSQSSELSEGDQFAILSVLYPIYRYGCPDYCSSEHNGSLCLLNGHNIFPVSKTDVPDSSVDISSLIAPEKVFKACKAFETCKVSGGVASCDMPSSCNTSGLCKANEICSGSCLQPDRAQCANYSEDCMDNAMCHDGHCYYKTLANNTATYPCSETRCCANGLYCVNNECSEQKPSFAGEYKLYTTFKVAEGYEAVTTEMFNIDNMTDDKWFAFVQQVVLAPAHTLDMFIIDNFFTETIPFDRKTLVDLAETILDEELNQIEIIQKIASYQKNGLDAIRQLELEGKLVLKEDMASGYQIYTYSDCNGDALPEEVFDVLDRAISESCEEFMLSCIKDRRAYT